MNDFVTWIMGLQQLGELRVSRGDSVNGSVCSPYGVANGRLRSTITDSHSDPDSTIYPRPRREQPTAGRRQHHGRVAGTQ
jgi:hypothetical protein